MKKQKTFYVTSPIFYPNANPHMGHAYTTLLCDVLARYHRLTGTDTHFLTGTDEHTEKVVQAAKKQGKKPDEYLEIIVERFKDLYARLDISYDQFIRTSDKATHWPGAIEMWNRLSNAGDIYKKSYSGLYCTGHEAFITKKELVGGKCPDHDEIPEEVKEENYFFALSKYNNEIKKRIESDELQILPQSRKNEILSLLNQGLEDVSFSRPANKMTWGIPVPNEENHTMYIWIDALSNYITALGFGRDEKLMNYWPGMHVIGKDILRFHAAIWPGMLLSAGLPLPKTILVHGFITSGGKKMSKTLGNVIDPNELIEKYGSEAVRYYLARHISPFEDGDMTMESFHEAYTANLVNGIGNLTSRIMKMAETHLESPVTIENENAPADFGDFFDRFEVHNAANHIWERISKLDETIQVAQPFKLVKTDIEKAETIIKELVADLYQIARMLEPILPETSEKILTAIKDNKKPESLFERID